MGDNVDPKTPPAPLILTATPVKIREDRLADLRKKSAASKVAAARIIREKNTKPSKTPLAQRAKSIGNTSSYPKNIIYFEDEKPITSTFKMTKEEYIDSYISGTQLRTMEDKLHLQDPGFNRGNLFFYYCINRICKIGIRMEEFNVKHKNNFPKVSSPIAAKKIRGKEAINPHHYELQPLIITGDTTQNTLNQPNEKWKNMIASFVD